MLKFFTTGATAPAPAAVLEQGSLTTVELTDNKNHKRQVLFYVPHSVQSSNSSKRTTPTPNPRLLLTIHGSLLTGPLFREHYTSHAYDVLALKHNLVIAYPTGFGNGWNTGWISKPNKPTVSDVDDISFLRDIITLASTRFGTPPLEARAALATGFSNGGALLLHTLLVSDGAIFAAVAVQGITLAAEDNYEGRIVSASTQNLIPVAFWHGDADRTVPMAGGETAVIRIPGLPPLMKRGGVRSLRDSAGVFVTRFADAGVPLEETAADIHSEDSGEIAGSRTVYTGEWKGEKRVLVQVNVLAGEGHNVSMPAANRVPGVMGPQVGRVHSPRAIIDFLLQAAAAEEASL